MSLARCALRAAGGWEPPPAGPVVSDTFSRANASTLGSAETGQAWTAHTGTWGVDTNKAKLVTQSGDSVATVDAGIADFEMTCDITKQGEPGIVFRTIDASNYLLAFASGGNIEIYQRVAGAYTLLGSGVQAYADGATKAWRVTGAGNVITAYIDAVQVVQVTTSQFNTQTRYGLRQNDGTAARYDNFVVDVP